SRSCWWSRTPPGPWPWPTGPTCWRRAAWGWRAGARTSSPRPRCAGPTSGSDAGRRGEPRGGRHVFRFETRAGAGSAFLPEVETGGGEDVEAQGPAAAQAGGAGLPGGDHGAVHGGEGEAGLAPQAEAVEEEGLAAAHRAHRPVEAQVVALVAELGVAGGDGGASAHPRPHLRGEAERGAGVES